MLRELHNEEIGFVAGGDDGREKQRNNPEIVVNGTRWILNGHDGSGGFPISVQFGDINESVSFNNSRADLYADRLGERDNENDPESELIDTDGDGQFDVIQVTGPTSAPPPGSGFTPYAIFGGSYLGAAGSFGYDFENGDLYFLAGISFGPPVDLAYGYSQDVPAYFTGLSLEASTPNAVLVATGIETSQVPGLATPIITDIQDVDIQTEVINIPSASISYGINLTAIWDNFLTTLSNLQQQAAEDANALPDAISNGLGIPDISDPEFHERFDRR